MCISNILPNSIKKIGCFNYKRNNAQGGKFRNYEKRKEKIKIIKIPLLRYNYYLHFGDFFWGGGVLCLLSHIYIDSLLTSSNLYIVCYVYIHISNLKSYCDQL